VHLWGNSAASLQPLLTPPPGASLWYDARVPFMREDAGDLAEIQTNEAATIVALSNGGFTRESVVKAVKSNDWTLLKPDPDWVSVQLQPGGNTAPAPTAPSTVPANGHRNGATR